MKPLTITIKLEEGPEFDTVILEINGVTETSVVARDEYVESRWGRYHNAKSRARHIVTNALTAWNFS